MTIQIDREDVPDVAVPDAEQYSMDGIEASVDQFIGVDDVEVHVAKGHVAYVTVSFEWRIELQMQMYREEYKFVTEDALMRIDTDRIPRL